VHLQSDGLCLSREAGRQQACGQRGFFQKCPTLSSFNVVSDAIIKPTERSVNWCLPNLDDK